MSYTLPGSSTGWSSTGWSSTGYGWSSTGWWRVACLWPAVWLASDSGLLCGLPLALACYRPGFDPGVCQRQVSLMTVGGVLGHWATRDASPPLWERGRVNNKALISPSYIFLLEIRLLFAGGVRGVSRHAMTTVQTPFRSHVLVTAAAKRTAASCPRQQDKTAVVAVQALRFPRAHNPTWLSFQPRPRVPGKLYTDIAT